MYQIPVIFQGVELPYVFADGEYHIAIKPICEAIGIVHDKAVEAIKNDEILGLLHTIRWVVGTHGKSREMVCLPLAYLNGWLFSINANKVGEQARVVLLAYKRECYKALHEHFFGRVQVQAEAQTTYNAIQAKVLELKELQKELRSSDTAKRIKKLQSELSNLRANMRDLTHEQYGKQLQLVEDTPTLPHTSHSSH